MLSHMRVISLFSGAGGLDFGLKSAGHTIVWANDFDSDAADTYRKNVGDHIICAPIENVSPADIPEGDVVVGGFPCQGFSGANRSRSRTDKRNALYLEFLRILRGKQPKYFVAENVSGILNLDRGKVVDRILNDFASAGYRVQFKLLNLANYGVPQGRRRVIFLGTRADLPSASDLSFPSATHASTPAPGLKPWISIGRALRGMPEPNEAHRLKNHICSQYKVSFRDFTGHRRTDATKPSPTILARGNGKGGVCAIHHPSGQRRLSVRESAIIQTFPRSFEFVGGLNSMYRQVGNAVPVLFAKMLGIQLSLAEAKARS